MASRGRIAAAFATIYLFWGVTFLALRYTVAEVPPMLTIAIRCVIGAAVIYAWLALRGRLERTTREQWLVAVGAGLLLFLGGHSVLAWAEMSVPSGQAALLLTAIPAWLVLIEAFRARRFPAGRVLAGLALGTAGVGLLTLGAGPGGGGFERIALVLAALAWAAGSLYARHGARPASAAQATAMQLAAGGVIVLAASASTGELSGFQLAATSPRALVSLLFLVLGGTVAGFAAYTWLLRVTSAAAVGSYAFVNPVIAVGLAWAVGDEAASPVTALAGLLVVSAVLLLGGWFRLPAWVFARSRSLGAPAARCEPLRR